MLEYAASKGANGINLSGICCTANETLMRQGIPLAGNFLQQELAILTGAVEAMVVDIQCIMQALVPLAEKFHTEIITTSPKAKITGATHIEFDEHRAMEIAKEIIKRAVDRYPERQADPNSRCGLRADSGLLARVHRIRPGRRLPRLLSSAERCHHQRAHSRGSGQHWLQQSAGYA